MGLYVGRGIHGEVVSTIGRRIVAGYYQSGDAVFAEDLEAELGVSKTVVREALKVLAAKGMVESRPKRGTVVRERASWNLLDPDLIAWRHQGNPSPDFLRDLSEVRFIVEPEAARLAARRRSDTDLDGLREALDAMAAAGEAGEAMIEADLAFHRAMLLASHNELLAQLEMLIEAGLRVRDQLVHRQGPWPDPVPAHREVLAAIERGDGEGAVLAMHRLLESASREAAELAGEPAGARSTSRKKTAGATRRQKEAIS